MRVGEGGTGDAGFLSVTISVVGIFLGVAKRVQSLRERCGRGARGRGCRAQQLPQAGDLRQGEAVRARVVLWLSLQTGQPLVLLCKCHRADS